MLLMLLALACSGTDGTVRTADPDPVVDPDPDTDDEVDDRELVRVSHQREFRGAWVATVWNINYPSGQSLSASQQRDELEALLDVIAASGCNAVVFQVRPESDALYDSALEPWSRYLTGSQGTDPGWDPLAVLVEEGHERGLEVHAWFNPYRAKADRNSTAASNHVSQTLSAHAHVYGSYLWMDPGAPPVQDHLIDVIADVTTRYDVDGIHFDDYFYPYPDGTTFPDSATYAAHGGGMSRDDWRRDNVNQMVRRVHQTVVGIKPWVRFGISPFGIYRPGQPPGITGLDQYAAIYSDPVVWKANHWVDYLAPQLYWPSTQTAQAYQPLMQWWVDQPGDSYIFAGNYLAQLGSSGAWDVDEFRTQVALTRAEASDGGLGNIWYHMGPLEENRSGIRDVFANELYASPALPPPVLEMADTTVKPPDTEPTQTGVAVSHDAARWWVVYREQGDAFVIDRILPASQAEISLEKGRWAVTAAGLHGVESRGVVIER